MIGVPAGNDEAVGRHGRHSEGEGVEVAVCGDLTAFLGAFERRAHCGQVTFETAGVGQGIGSVAKGFHCFDDELCLGRPPPMQGCLAGTGSRLPADRGVFGDASRGFRIESERVAADRLDLIGRKAPETH